jgi:6-phosphogluconolactonase
MGADMHTASLFPGADRLEEAFSSPALLMPMRAEAAGEPRVTLTAPVLKGAFHIHLLITGAEKRAALDRALTLPVAEAPVRAILDNATVHWAE